MAAPQLALVLPAPATPDPLKLTGVNVKKATLENGEERFYYRHRKTGANLGSSDDHDAVHRAYAAVTSASPNTPHAGTIDMMIREFTKSPGMSLEVISKKTQVNYFWHLEKWRLALRDVTPNLLTVAQIMDHLDTLGDKVTTRFQRLKMLRQLYNWKEGRRKYKISFSPADEAFARQPAARTADWSWEERKKMYDGLPEAERCALYKSMSVRGQQKKSLRKELHRLGVLAEDKLRLDYGATIDDLDEMYRAACEAQGLEPKKIFDGLSVRARAALYDPAGFTELQRAAANLRHAYMRLASLMTYYLGQRRGDLLKIMRSESTKRPDGLPNDAFLRQERDASGRMWVWAQVTQGKSKQRARNGAVVVYVPLHPKLEHALREHAATYGWRGPFVLSGPKGGFWDVHNFSDDWREECELLGIACDEDGNLHQHDTRRTIRTDLAEAGCTPEEISAVTGHDLRILANSPMATVYTAKRKQFGVNAIEKLMRWEAAREAARLDRAARGLTGDSDAGDADFMLDAKALPAPTA